MSQSHIVFVQASGREVEVERGDVAPSVAFVTVDGVPVPVARIESHSYGRQRLVRSYAADGRLLMSTIESR